MCAKQAGLVFINCDDMWIQKLQNMQTKNKILFGVNSKLTGNDCAIFGTLKNSLLHIKSQNEHHLNLKKIDFKITPSLPGEHNARNIVAAIAIAWSLHVSEQQISQALSSFQAAEGRSQIKKISSHTVFCDYYNANPTSVRAALESCVEINQASPKNIWVVLGDMLELGRNEEKLHRDLAQDLKRFDLDKILLFGPKMQWLSQEMKIQHFSDKQKMAKHLLEHLKKSDLILIKGSRGMKMEEVFQRIEDSCK